MAKTIASASLATLVLAVVVVIFALEYGSPVSRRGVRDLHVTDNSSGHPATVTVDGALIGSSLAVTSVKQHRRDRCIVVTVRQSIVLPNRRVGSFHTDIAITDDVDEIAFGDPREIIWHR